MSSLWTESFDRVVVAICELMRESRHASLDEIRSDLDEYRTMKDSPGWPIDPPLRTAMANAWAALEAEYGALHFEQPLDVLDKIEEEHSNYPNLETMCASRGPAS